MNLIELMQEHPGQKYRRKPWNKDMYIYQDGTNWRDEDGGIDNDTAGAGMFVEDWELYSKKIHLTVDDVGKKVRLEAGAIMLITGAAPTGLILASELEFNPDGTEYETPRGSEPAKIVEVL